MAVSFTDATNLADVRFLFDIFLVQARLYGAISRDSTASTGVDEESLVVT